eukprot:gnl/TRDRNA2_/TRDRNA2_59818_c0_seq1.p1 gnl/TRDRNA2_/TRDRNA2_59818_c0~~gnl/TRDRNA2_/TRDRNA2_59818_c0_seq1.p1  ORF type:complete len:134 (-),score=5.53 gnl/TRDRNA2_/TRDRNA2_59818_c0_seq1:225-626(-)
MSARSIPSRCEPQRQPRAALDHSRVNPLPLQGTQSHARGQPRSNEDANADSRPAIRDGGEAPAKHTRSGGHVLPSMSSYSHSAVINQQIKTSDTIEVMLSKLNAPMHTLNHINLATCWISLSRLYKQQLAERR